MGREAADALFVAPAGLRDGFAVDDAVGRVDADGLGLDADGLRRESEGGEAREDRRGEALSRGHTIQEKAGGHQSASNSSAVFRRGRTAAEVPSSDPTRAPRAFEPGQVEVQVSFQVVVEV